MKRVISVIFAILLAVVLYFLLKDIDFYELYLILANMDLLWVGLAVLSLFMTFIVWNMRWTFLYSRIFKRDFWFMLNVLLAGAFFNTITPGAGIGGEPFRAHFLAKRYKKSRTSMLAYVLADKFYQIMALVAFAVFSIFFVLIYVKISGTLKLVLEGILIFIILGSGLTIYFTLKKMNFNLGAFLKRLHIFKFVNGKFKKPEDFEHFINRKVKVFAHIFRKAVKDRKHMVEAVVLSFIFWMLNFLTSYFLFVAFNYKVNFLSVIIVVTLGNLIGALSVVPGGIAVTEITMTLLFSAMGILKTIALVVAFLTRMIYYFFSIPIGALSLWYIRRVTRDKESIAEGIS
jgi:uncharacterized protein (TIRG00374 family)